MREVIARAREEKKAVGHFNISTVDQMWAIFNAARRLDVPVIIGVSEGERDFLGLRQAVALVKIARQSENYPLFINADHTYSFDRVREAVDAGCDAVIFDGAKLSYEENLKITKECVDYARKVNPEIMVEGELGYIGTSSKLFDSLPEGAALKQSDFTTVEQARAFVNATGVDLFSPAVGSVHGMLRKGNDPDLDIVRISEIAAAVPTPLVLHGASGLREENVREAIAAGISLVHINTEIRVAWRDALKLALQEEADEVAPYKLLKSSSLAVSKVVEQKLKLFNGF